MCIETAFCDRLLHGFGRLQFGACIFVPETERTIRSNRCQCPVNGMKSDIVDRINVLNVCIRIYTVAFKCEIIFGIDWIHLKPMGNVLICYVFQVFGYAFCHLHIVLQRALQCYLAHSPWAFSFYHGKSTRLDVETSADFRCVCIRLVYFRASIRSALDWLCPQWP